jgi:hypothetical protein
MKIRESDLAAIDLAKLREAAADSGVTLLGATAWQSLHEAEKAKKALAVASVDLLAWEKALPTGRWMERPEQETLEARFRLDSSSTVLLGEPGAGKSALLSKVPLMKAEGGKSPGYSALFGSSIPAGARIRFLHSSE